MPDKQAGAKEEGLKYLSSSFFLKEETSCKKQEAQYGDDNHIKNPTLHRHPNLFAVYKSRSAA